MEDVLFKPKSQSDGFYGNQRSLTVVISPFGQELRLGQARRDGRSGENRRFRQLWDIAFMILQHLLLAA